MLQGSYLVVWSVLCACRDAQCCFCIHITMRLMLIMSQRCVQPCMCLGSMPCSISSSFTETQHVRSCRADDAFLNENPNWFLLSAW